MLKALTNDAPKPTRVYIFMRSTWSKHKVNSCTHCVVVEPDHIIICWWGWHERCLLPSICIRFHPQEAYTLLCCILDVIRLLVRENKVPYYRPIDAHNKILNVFPSPIDNMLHSRSALLMIFMMKFIISWRRSAYICSLYRFLYMQCYSACSAVNSNACAMVCYRSGSR